MLSFLKTVETVTRPYFQWSLRELFTPPPLTLGMFLHSGCNVNNWFLGPFTYKRIIVEIIGFTETYLVYIFLPRM